MPQCCVCQRSVDAEDVVTFGADTVCPDCKTTYVQGLKEGVETRGDQCRRAGALVVVSRSAAVLPRRCLVCNGAAAGPRRTYPTYWCAGQRTLLATAVVFPPVLILYAILRQKIPVQYYLCLHHERRRRLGTAIIVTGLILGAAMRVAGWFFASDLESIALVAFAQLVIALAIGCALGPPKPKPVKLDDDHVWLVGVGEPLHNSLPEL